MEEFDNEEEEVDNELLDDEGRLDGTGTLVTTVVAVAVPEPNAGPAVDVPPSAELTSWNLLLSPWHPNPKLAGTMKQARAILRSFQRFFNMIGNACVSFQHIS